MGKRLQTIFQYFSEYSEEDIKKVIKDLPLDEFLLVKLRYGVDLYNPVTSELWTKMDSKKFYGIVIPKIRKLLKIRSLNKDEVVENNTVDVENSIVDVENSTVDVVDVDSNSDSNEEEVEIVESENVDQTAVLLQLLKEEKTNREMCEILNVSNAELCEMLLKLKNMGFMHSRKYYSDGSIKYNNVNTMSDLKKLKFDQDRTIITCPYENTMKILLISDLHFGNDLERLDLIDRVYNYCIKNGINIILCGGDLVDGSFSRGTQNITDLYKQVEYFIRNYPYDSSILTFGVAGDHDISVFKNMSLDMIELFNNYRHDVIIGGYNNMGINLKNDKIHMYHHIDGGEMRQTDAPIILHGHSHKYSTGIKNSILNITISTLSNITQVMPSALELNLNFNKGYITNSVVKHIYFGDSDIVLGESSFDLTGQRSLNTSNIINIEDFSRNLGQSDIDNLGNGRVRRPLSQIEKFNRRYGNR